MSLNLCVAEKRNSYEPISVDGIRPMRITPNSFLVDFRRLRVHDLVEISCGNAAVEGGRIF